MSRPGRMFRYVRADEIDARIGVDSGPNNGVSLLLYKDARCDMNILDQTVGPMNWKRQHSRDNANCLVSIYNAETGEWVGKEDTGVESRTEAVKGLASDSFKRACVNWGIGRELYSAPFIWVDAGNVVRDKNGKCRMRFNVDRIEYDDNDNIVDLQISDGKGKIVYNMGMKRSPKPVEASKSSSPAKAPVKVEVSDTVKKTPAQVVAESSNGKASERNMEWKRMANSFHLTSKELAMKYEELVKAGVLPAIPLKELSDVQFEAMAKVFNENIHVA